MTHDHPILLTGATGYVGGRLLERLAAAGRPLRCMARRPAHLAGRTPAEVEVVQGDVTDERSLDRALRGIGTAFYLVHSMSHGPDFAEHDRRAAESFGAAARRQGVRRIIYLGGLGAGSLSPHLASRQQVGRIFRESGVPTIELRAGIIIGSGSLSFEIIRALVERLPLMITPRWVGTATQPIAIEDVLAYLEAAIDLPGQASAIYEIGGADRASYRDLMREYARQRGLSRAMIAVPVLTPRLSSLWLGLVTPVYARVGRELVDGLRNETVVSDDRAMRDFAIRPRGLADAIARALANEDREVARTRWSDALSSGGNRGWGGVTFGSRRVDSRTARVDVTPEQAFEPIMRIGGATGWYFADWLWSVRGFIDLLVGGVGSRRGRRDPTRLRPGDTLDFWRVEAIDPARSLRLVAEMRLPGRAWLQFDVEPEGLGTRIRQTAIFDPRGLAGLLYWYGIYPLHGAIFGGMLRGIVRAAAAGAARPRGEIRML